MKTMTFGSFIDFFGPRNVRSVTVSAHNKKVTVGTNDPHFSLETVLISDLQHAPLTAIAQSLWGNADWNAIALPGGYFRVSRQDSGTGLVA